MGNSVSQGYVPQGAGSGRCGWYNRNNLRQLYSRLREGDLVEFDRKTYRHWAVCVEVSDKWAMVIHINLDTGITEVELEEVLGEDECRVNNANDESLAANSGSETAERARYYMKFPDEFGGYHVVSNNCEHLATLCRYNERRSGQVRRAVGLTVAGAVGAVAVAGIAYALAQSLKNSQKEEEEENKKQSAVVKYC